MGPEGPAPQATAPPATVGTSATSCSGTNAKKKAKKSNQIMALLTTKGMLWPWTTSLGMTEYESKEQRCADRLS